MKVSIEGSIIETENIYQIDPIVGDDCWVDGNSWRPEKIQTHSGYEFTIKFFNKKDLKISRSGNDVFKDDLWWDHFGSDKTKRITKEDYEHKLSKIYNELDIFRDQVIDYWNNGKSEIPKIYFKK